MKSALTASILAVSMLASVALAAGPQINNSQYGTSSNQNRHSPSQGMIKNSNGTVKISGIKVTKVANSSIYGNVGQTGWVVNVSSSTKLLNANRSRTLSVSNIANGDTINADGVEVGGTGAPERALNATVVRDLSK